MMRPTGKKNDDDDDDEIKDDEHNTRYWDEDENDPAEPATTGGDSASPIDDENDDDDGEENEWDIEDIVVSDESERQYWKEKLLRGPSAFELSASPRDPYSSDEERSEYSAPKKIKLPSDKKPVAIGRSKNQRNYTYSDPALIILDAIKKHTKIKLNDFVSEAIIAHGKSILPKEHIPKNIVIPKSAVDTIEDKIQILERVISSLGIQYIKENVAADSFAEMSACVREGENNPYSKDFLDECSACGKSTNQLKGKHKKALWWALFYANSKGLL